MGEEVVTASLQTFRMLVGGERVEAAGSNTFTTFNPARGEPWATIPEASPTDVDNAVVAAREALENGPWSTLSASARGLLLIRLADLIATRATEFATIETRDNGKIFKETSAQVAALARWWRYYGGLADKIEGSVLDFDIPSIFTYTVREPVGVVAAIVPWNSPLMLATWKMAPALAAGNTVVIKPSEFTSASLLAFADLFAEAGFPDGVVNVITGSGASAGEALVSHPGVDHITFTGGPRTAEAIARSAAANLTPTTFELGGKSANVVFADCDMDAAISGVLAGVFAATGQTCIAGSRLVVEGSIKEEFVGRLAERARSIVMGDPMSEDTQMGPVTTQAQLETITSIVDEAIAEGAQLTTGGKPEGLFFPPTILTGVTPDQRVAQEEIFGPVLSVLEFDTDDEAVSVANSTKYSLAAGLWTRDVKRVHRLAGQLRAGTVYVNTYRAASPMAPFGGSGRSGHGRENGIDAVREFTKTKTVWVETGSAIPDPFVQRL